MSVRNSRPRRLIPAACRQVATQLAAEFAQQAARRDRERIIAFEEYDKLRASGLLALRVPEEAGGPGCSIAQMAEIIRIMSKGDPNITQAMSSHYLVADTVRLWGTAEQQAKFLSALLGGEIINNAFAERGTKFVGEIKTCFSRDGAGYRLNGTKFYSTGALMADRILVYAKSENNAAAFLIVPRDRDGLTLVDDWTGMGQRTTGSGTTIFKNVKVEPDEVLLLPNFTVTRSFFGALAQIIHVAIDTGIAAAALEDAIDFARTSARPVPESGVERQVDDPYAVSAVGHMAVLVHQAEEMLKRAAASLQSAVDAQFGGVTEPADLERTLCEASVAVAEAKISATEASLRVSEMLFSIAGASATLGERNYDRHWRNARTHTTHDPVAYKYKVVGDYFLSGRLPPISTKI